MIYRIKCVLGDTYHNICIHRHFKRYYKIRLQCIDSKNRRYHLPNNLKRDYIDYYRSFGFKSVCTRDIELLYSLTGQYDKRIISDELFNTYIDPIYPCIRDFWQNKSYQKDIIKTAQFPNTIVRNVNGYYLDNDDNIISEYDSILRISKYDRVVIKPTLFTGGGYNVRFFNGNELTKDILHSYGEDFIVQEKLTQSSLLASFNESSVNTIKMMSFLYKGEVYILAAFLRIGPENSYTDNVTGHMDGCVVYINESGQLSDFGYDNRQNIVYETKSGVKFSGLILPHYNECVEIVKKAHKHLLYFPIVSWDFAQSCDGSPVLIEYNMKYHDLFDYQIWCGPIFGDLTEDVLNNAFQFAKQSQALIYR